MNAHERLESSIKLQPLPAGEVPVAPLMITFIARLAGMKQAEIFNSVKAWRQAVDRAIDRIGPPDMGFAIFPRDVPFSEGLPEGYTARRFVSHAICHGARPMAKRVEAVLRSRELIIHWLQESEVTKG